MRRTPVLEPEAYGLLLHGAGLTGVHVRAQVFLHQLPEREALVQWMAGTTLTAYQRRLPEPLYARFLADYALALQQAVPASRPLAFPFRRTLMRATRPA